MTNDVYEQVRVWFEALTWDDVSGSTSLSCTTTCDLGQFREPRYFVSNVLRPLIRPLISDDEYREACAAAARSLYPVWVTPETSAEAS